MPAFILKTQTRRLHGNSGKLPLRRAFPKVLGQLKRNNNIALNVAQLFEKKLPEGICDTKAESWSPTQTFLPYSWLQPFWKVLSLVFRFIHKLQVAVLSVFVMWLPADFSLISCTCMLHSWLLLVTFNWKVHITFKKLTTNHLLQL